MTAYNSLCEAYLQLLSLDPNTCVELGLTEKLGQLPDPSLNMLHKTAAMATQLGEDAKALAPELGDFNQRLDAQLIALSARQVELQSRLSFNGKLQSQQLPDAGEAISSGIFLLVTNDPRPAPARLQNITDRLAQVPRYLQQALQRLDTPVARWIDIDVETIEGLPDYFATILEWAATEKFPALDELRATVDKANSALADYCKALRQLPTTTVFSIGPENAQALIAANGIELSLPQIHQVACEFVQRTSEEIETLRVKLVEKYGLEQNLDASELQQYLASRYGIKVDNNDFSQVIQRYKDIATTIEDFVTERGLFPIPQGQAMNIMQTPGFMAPMIPAGAMMPPAALREGTRTSLVYLTLSAELMDEHTELGIPIMMVHEGIPGHHLQLSTAAMQESLVRRTFSANEHAEGWTTMLEDYMLDIGLMGELTDEARFVTKLDISRIGARVAIDLYFMTGEVHYLDIGYNLEFTDADPFANAAALLIAATGFTPGRAQAELNWYSQERGYPLSYLVGNHLIWQLKRDYQSALTGRMSGLEID